MGVPKFYRWVSERYPLINQKIGKDTQFLPKFDNMYLDMNGIIHNCTHPNDEDVTNKISMKDMVLGMFSYVDRMVHIVRPQKVLVLAVDGCAPRAKMNQQRSRRFASAKDRREGLEKALREEKMTEEEVRDQFDSNCITPGTEFMEQVSQHFQYFIRLKVKEDPLWRKLKVIYSGHDVPGEGEHKIMDYIRHSRMQPGYDPNTRHCLCGLDADLIMLGLASHEPHFALLREEVDFTGGRGGKKGGSTTTKEVKKQVEQDKWELLHLSALRQYLDLEFRSDQIPFGYNLERVIDDWVLLVMLVGNDFLPHLPSLSIAEGGLDDLMAKYREKLPTMGGYITEGGKVHFDRLEVMLQTIGAQEDRVFSKRVADERKRQKRENRRMGQPRPTLTAPENGTGSDGDDINKAADDAFDSPFGKEARDRGIVTDTSSFKEKYYGEKFGITVHDREVVDKLVHSYIEGIQWCYLYYYQGVQSWTWFFPFHYAPMASDMKNLSRFNIHLKLGEPFHPFMQLLSCLPADSAGFLPACYRELMTLTTSPLAEFYPRDFKVDMNGKRNPWEGVNLLPFIDEARLVKAVAKHCPEEKLTDEERARNTFGHEIIVELDTSNTGTVKSSFPQAGLRDILVCQTSSRRYQLPPMDRHIPDLLPGTVSDGRWPGDPQLVPALTLRSDLPGKLYEAGVCVFNRESSRESLIVNVRDPGPAVWGEQATAAACKARDEDDESFAYPVTKALEVLQQKCKDRLTVFVNYPNLREAQVMAVADDSYVFTLQEERRKQFRFIKAVQTEEDSELFFNNAEMAQDRALKGNRAVGTGGVDIGEVLVMLKVRPLQRMEVDIASGSARQVFSDTETWVPYQLVCYNNTARDPRFEPRKAKDPADRFPANSKIMCLQKVGYGLVGTVVGHEDHALRAEFKELNPQIPPFGHTIANSIVDQYINSNKAARHFGIDSATLGKITGSVLVRPGHHDIGLNLKVGRSYVIAGYVRSRSAEANKPAWSTGETVTVISGLDPVERAEGGADLSAANGGWEYTSRALELVAAYRKKFPQVFQAIQAKPNTVEYTISDMFGSGEEGKKLLDEVCQWLEQIDTFRLPLVPITSKSMSRAAIQAVQRASDDVRKAVLKKTKQNRDVVVKISPDVVFRYGSDIEAEWLKSPTCSVPPRLGDRVVNMGSPVVPFGLGGTVVATHASTGCVEVVFDTEFIGGTSLYGACGNNRGKLLPWSQLLNLSKKVFLTAGRPDLAASQAAPAAKPSKGASGTGKKSSSASDSGSGAKNNEEKSTASAAAKRAERKQTTQDGYRVRGKNDTAPPIPQPAQSKFVVPPVPSHQAQYQHQPPPAAAVPQAFHFPQSTPVTQSPEEIAALNALQAGIGSNDDQATFGQQSQSEQSDEPAGSANELAQFWAKLQSEKKAKRRERKTRKVQQVPAEVVSQPTVQAPQQQQKGSAPVVTSQPSNSTADATAALRAALGFVPQQQQQQTQQPHQGKQVPAIPPQPPTFAQQLAPPQPPVAVPMQQPAAPPSASNDPLDDLFKRAAKATGKEYKQPSMQQQQSAAPMPSMPSQPMYGAYPQPGAYYNYPQPPPPPPQQQQQQQKK